MLTNQIVSAARVMGLQARRNYGVSAVLLAKASDPIQQLFVNKLREYAQKSQSAGGKLVDASPAIERELKQEMEKLAKQYGGAQGEDMTAFPSFKFEEPKIDPINSSA
ncbi:mitochondrial ATP synthase coupling factor 6 [Anopheles darlingi]|uniref:ATP synthase-coupling factor 6, mitochondrial n=1 Tax=Anopheles darlingi TaxID=43151 RepID=B6DDV7_ANODA|nr:ATP synthase-coupling factor 6, mitochondrial [Anopheles darlingi]ETN60559.1 mitochondrial ATP synthase coupling factor 6 [Anopheles darlingi]